MDWNTLTETADEAELYTQMKDIADLRYGKDVPLSVDSNVTRQDLWTDDDIPF